MISKTDIIIFFIALCSILIINKVIRIFYDQIMHLYISRKVVNDFVDGDSEESVQIESRADLGLSNKKKSLLDHDEIKEFINTNKERIDNIKRLLLKAGRREENDFMDFILKDLGLYCVAMIAASFYGITEYIVQGLAAPIAIAASIPTGIVLGYNLAVSNLEAKAQERQDSIDNGVPALIDLLVVCTDSGLDLNRAIARIAREMRHSNLELSDELTLTAVEIEMIPDFKQVFSNMENRTDSLQIKSLAKTLSQSIEYGSPLSGLLKQLSIEARQRKILLAEERAARIPTILTLPLMLFILPCLFIVMLGPVVAEVMSSFNM